MNTIELPLFYGRNRNLGTHLGSEQFSIDEPELRSEFLRPDDFSENTISLIPICPIRPRLRNAPEMARYITYLFPGCVRPPSRHIVEALLQAINVKSNYVAFIACLLDSLSEVFFLRWLNVSNEFKTVRPEVIVIACISVSMKFLDDLIYPINCFLKPFNQIMELFSINEALSVSEIVNLEISILEDLDFDLVPLCTVESLRHMLRQIEACKMF
jgi:hypothetical protein